MSDGTGPAEALLGLDGFGVLEVTETSAELIIHIETTATIVGCWGCGARAQSQGRMLVHVRDLPCFGRPARLVWNKRRWRCREPLCEVKTWTEESVDFDTQAVITRRAGAEVCRQVGAHARSVRSVAAELGVCWWTAMNAVIEHGTGLVDDPRRVGRVGKLGVDETSFLAATPTSATQYVTGLVDLDRRRVIDVAQGNSAADLRRWCSRAHPGWLAGIKVVATDLTDSYRAGLSPHLDHARRVADPFHFVRLGNRCVDQVRRRVQNETLGHRGRKRDPLFRIRKLMLTGAERLDERGTERMLLGLRAGDPHDEVLGAWLAKESVRDVYLADTYAEAKLLLDKAITGCRADDVDEIRSLANTLAKWRPEILEYHRSGASNGPTEGLNLLVKKVKRCGHGFTNFRALPTPRPPPHRRRHLARSSIAATHPNPLSPLKRVGPHWSGAVQDRLGRPASLTGATRWGAVARSIASSTRGSALDRLA